MAGDHATILVASLLRYEIVRHRSERPGNKTGVQLPVNQCFDTLGVQPLVDAL